MREELENELCRLISDDGTLEHTVKEVSRFILKREIELLEELKVEPIKEGVHSGHEQDDGWCYNCGRMATEDEHAGWDDYKYNEAVKDFNHRIDELIALRRKP